MGMPLEEKEEEEGRRRSLSSPALTTVTHFHETDLKQAVVFSLLPLKPKDESKEKMLPKLEEEIPSSFLLSLSSAGLESLKAAEKKRKFKLRRSSFKNESLEK